ncbi:hypothetical protein ABGB07_39880 [Micromonosporaceae bacterium B7E4]
MAPVLLKRTVRPGQAYAVQDVDQPTRGVLAVAVNGPEGWSVATPAGVIGSGLDRRRATALMIRTAVLAAGRSTTPLLTGGGR